MVSGPNALKEAVADEYYKIEVLTTSTKTEVVTAHLGPSSGTVGVTEIYHGPLRTQEWPAGPQPNQSPPKSLTRPVLGHFLCIHRAHEVLLFPGNEN